MPSITPDGVRAAAARIRPLAKRTPVITSSHFDDAASARIFFKCENLQTGGAFKIRGASNLILSIPPADLPRGVVAFSSGNHAIAVAIAARHAGAAATIVMPADAPRSKLETARAYGAHIVTYDRLRESREAIAAQILEESGATLVPPFDHPMIAAGQGTAALELLEDAPDLDAVIAPVGGGGLLSGSAIIAKDIRPAIRLFGVEPADGNDTFLSFQAGERRSIPLPQTIADGLRAPEPGTLTFPIIRQLVEQILLVTDDEIRTAVMFLLTRLKILVEPSGAVGAAALLFDKLPAGIGKVGVILSGGNMDIEQLNAGKPCLALPWRSGGGILR
ncbi:MAG TPA: threonine/serine dehydratase [Bryobacteraceae bacterium]|nr:threonine/serine dehydratase [Bryobacteraceae bacterium]